MLIKFYDRAFAKFSKGQVFLISSTTLGLVHIALSILNGLNMDKELKENYEKGYDNGYKDGFSSGVTQVVNTAIRTQEAKAAEQLICDLEKIGIVLTYKNEHLN